MFLDNKLCQDYDESNLTHTWAPNENINIESDCAHIWCGGKTLDQVCPPGLIDHWTKLNKDAKSHLNSIKHAKISLDDVCFYDLVPESFLIDFYGLKNKICEHVFQSHDRPKNHKFLHDLILFCKALEKRNLNLNFANLNLADSNVKKGFSKIKKYSPTIRYDAWGTATGRLTTKKDSFPILTLNKELRPAIVPSNDLFVEFDFNAAELRVLFGLLGQEQPCDDIHTWINKNIFESKYDRETSKKKVFSWLYNPKAKNKKLNGYLDRNRIYEQYYVGNKVETPYGRSLEVEEQKAVNFLIQSTSSDMFMTSALVVNEILKGKKSYIAFCIHDSLVIDFSAEDRKHLLHLKESFSKTKFGQLRTNLRIGKNFGTMREIV